MEVTGGRVQAMGVVHQICSHAPTGDLAEIVTSVCTNLIKADPRFELKLETEQVIVPVQKATVVALISNELVTNAMKYALRDRKVGRIAVSLRPGDGNSVVLSVSDDGAPSAADVQPHVNGTGLDLIARLAKQLAGELRVESAPKRYSVVFPSHFAVCG
jgi:two-component sensor histidine kinase